MPYTRLPREWQPPFHPKYRLSKEIHDPKASADRLPAAFFCAASFRAIRSILFGFQECQTTIRCLPQPPWSAVTHGKQGAVQHLFRRSLAGVERSAGLSYSAWLSIDATLRRLRPSAAFRRRPALGGRLRRCSARCNLRGLRSAHAGNRQSISRGSFSGMRAGS